jgi:hypothetical protein
MTKLAHQSQSEYNAGYASGFRGEPEPLKSKGRAHWFGWLNGKMDREGK